MRHIQNWWGSKYVLIIHVKANNTRNSGQLVQTLIKIYEYMMYQFLTMLFYIKRSPQIASVSHHKKVSKIAGLIKSTTCSGDYEMCESFMSGYFLYAFNRLTLRQPGYDIFVLWNWPKTSSCQLPYQHHNSSADCARELFKDSNGSPTLLVCTRKKLFGWGCFFVNDVISELVFRPFWLMLPGLGLNR